MTLQFPSGDVYSKKLMKEKIGNFFCDLH